MPFHFQSKGSPDVMMLPDLTETIFKIIGKAFEKRGIFLVDQLPGTIEKLEAAIENDKKIKNQLQQSSIDTEIGFLDERVQLSQSAFPFLELLKNARDNQKEITWHT